MKHRVLTFIIYGFGFLWLNGCTNEVRSERNDIVDIIEELPSKTLDWKQVSPNASETLKEELFQIANITEILDFIESNAELPARVSPISDYHRYYATRKFSTKDVIHNRFDLVVTLALGNWGIPRHGQYIKIPKREKTYFVSDDNLPFILDGGCSMVTIYFDTKKMEFRKISDPFGPIDKKSNHKLYDGICNGYA